MKPSLPKATGMFEVKVPGSVFGHRHEMIAAIATPSSKETPAAALTSQKETSAAAGVERRPSVRKVEATTMSATSIPSSASAAAAKGKSPLRSVMSTSRSTVTATTGPSNVQGQSTTFEWFGGECTWGSTAKTITKANKNGGLLLDVRIRRGRLNMGKFGVDCVLFGPGRVGCCCECE